MSDGTTETIVRWRVVADHGTFEAALVALDEIVTFLETGHRGLDETIAAYEIGTRVARRCETLLGDAELRVSQIAVETERPRPVRFIDDQVDDEPDDDEPEDDGPDGDATDDEAPF